MEDLSKEVSGPMLIETAVTTPDCMEVIADPLFPKLSDEPLKIATGPLKQGSRQVAYDYYGLRLGTHYIWKYDGDVGSGVDTEPPYPIVAKGSNGAGSNTHPGFMIADTLGMPIGVEVDGWIQHSCKWWVLKTPLGIARRVGFKIHKGYLVDDHAWVLVRVRGEVGLALFSVNGEITVGLVNKGIKNEFNGLSESLRRDTTRIRIANQILERSLITFKIYDSDKPTEIIRDNRGAPPQEA